MSFHLITHAVCVAVIATLVRKYLYVSYQLEEQEILYDACMNHIEGGGSLHHESPHKTDHLQEKNDYDDITKNEQTLVHGFNEKVNKFETSQEMEYYDEYLGTKSHDPGGTEDVEEYIGTTFHEASSKYSIHTSKLDVVSSTTNEIPNNLADSSKSESLNNYALDKNYTSGWCQGSTSSNKICHFRNLCYHTVHKDFIFFQSEHSVAENLFENSDSPYILDLSSVANHNLHYFSVQMLPSDSIQNFTIHWIKTKSLLFNRFKPDNIMHILHDDILPLHQTLKLISYTEHKNNQNRSEKFDIQVVSLDGWDEEIEFDFLYNYFSIYKLQTQQSLAKLSPLVCFKDIHVGISKSTTWYQYGFYKPQGPVEDISVTAHHIHDTVNFILSQIDRDCPLCSMGDYFVLFSRKETRRILNEMDLSVTIAQKLGIKVMSVSLETHSLQDIINIVHKSKGAIGMHGSLLSLTMFLKPGSVLIELFPFAVNPFHYTPYKTLAQLPNMDIAYESWLNTNEEKTVMHPDWTPELGGIYHLKNQQEIMNQKEVPLHLCCEDPSWLFHIYQDTTVDIQAVLSLIKTALSKHSGKLENTLTMAPGNVRIVKCVVDKNSAKVKWKAPWSAYYLRHKTISYELWVHNVQTNRTVSYTVGNVTSYVVEDVKPNVKYLVWMRCQLDNIFGYFDKPVECH